MPKIKFLHDYWKLHNIAKRTPVILLQVFVVDKKDLSPDFVEYDTAIHPEGHYKLPNGKLIVLLFYQGMVLFTTIRRWTPEKERYYTSQMGETFEVVIEDG